MFGSLKIYFLFPYIFGTQFKLKIIFGDSVGGKVKILVCWYICKIGTDICHLKFIEFHLQDLAKYIFTILSTIYRYNLFIFLKINRITVWQCIRIGPVSPNQMRKRFHRKTSQWTTHGCWAPRGGVDYTGGRARLGTLVRPSWDNFCPQFQHVT